MLFRGCLPLFRVAAVACCFAAAALSERFARAWVLVFVFAVFFGFAVFLLSWCFWAAFDCDCCVLFDVGVVLSGECCGHCEFCGAEGGFGGEVGGEC